ncbi:MAG TPA: protein kinase [Terriglobales bacterium]|nr:protein kinase [Terriglobales bacterium]
MLAPGTRLGPYEILAPLGAGGMGEVFRARDTRLGRDVALKVMAQRLGSSPELRARFEREARAVGALHHPNICVLHDVGSSAGVEFLVMEYLEGQSLAERLRRGPLPLAEVVRIGGEIASALERAHRSGIVHRDLKPANILLTVADGKPRAKLLDFGLARPAAAAGTASTPSWGDAATILDAPVTTAGAVLGTIPYMAPEQIEGREADARSDIYAFGCVLYEMATGRRAHHDLATGLQRVEPPALDQVIAACLERHPDQRLQSAHDVGWALAQLAAPPLPAAIVPWWRRTPGSALASALTAAILLIAAAVWFAARSGSLAPPAATLRFSLDLPADQAPDVYTGWLNLAFSPDGRSLVMVASAALGPLYLRRLDQFAATALPGTENADSPFFSPDGRWIGFFADGHLQKISVSGGPATVLCDAPSDRGAAWLPASPGQPDGTIVFAPSTSTGLLQISADGGAPSPFTTLDPTRDDRTHRWPQRLPGGAVLFSAGRRDSASNQDESSIVAYVPASRRRVTLVDHAAMARFLPAAPGATRGYLLYAHAATLFAVPFDASRLRLAGEARPVLEGVGETVGSGATQFAVSPSGDLAYMPGSADYYGAGSLSWAAPGVGGTRGAAALQPLPLPTNFYARPALSPDDRLIALEVGVANAGSSSDIYIWDIARHTLNRLTFSGHASSPAWFPDSRRVLYRVSAPQSGIYWKAADGSGTEHRLLLAPGDLSAPAVSPDGKFLAYGSGPNIIVQPLAASGPTQTIAGVEPGFSPNGRWLSYMADNLGGTFVQAFPGSGGKWQIAAAGARNFTAPPAWSPDGRALYYLQGDAVVRLPLTPGPTFAPGAPVVLFHDPALILGRSAAAARLAGVAHDGRILLLARHVVPNAPPPTIRVVLNFAATLGH